jgi:hypothetical protein
MKMYQHKNLGVGGWIVLRWILDISYVDKDCTDLTQDRDQCRALMNTTLKFRVP